jgi:anti-sigma regulatory factor (Ser/Thr protein kinase)
VALLLGLLEATQIYAGAALQGQPVTIAFALTTLPTWLVLATITLPTLYLARRLRLDRGRWRRNLPTHIVASLIFATAHLAGAGLVRTIGPGLQENFWDSFVFQLRYFFALDVVTYWAIVGATQAYEYYREGRERELSAARLETRLTKARLQTLRGQLNPHFLFNTLNAISTLALRGSRDAAADAIGQLSDLLRLSLDDDLAQEIPLSQELELLDGYEAIMRTRFGERLKIEREVDSSVKDALVPSLVLQPLVENAVLHGVMADPTGGCIRIVADRIDHTVRLTVHDSGPGFSKPPAAQEGIGLQNTRGRLAELYGSDAELTIGTSDEGGASVTVRLPYRST